MLPGEIQNLGRSVIRGVGGEELQGEGGVATEQCNPELIFCIYEHQITCVYPEQVSVFPLVSSVSS